MQRVTVYIDGFNLYYALLNPNPAVRWLDLAALGSALRPAATVTVRYFTAALGERLREWRDTTFRRTLRIVMDGYRAGKGEM